MSSAFGGNGSLAGFPAAHQITTRGDHGLAALRPERRDDVGRPRSPIKTGEGRLLDSLSASIKATTLTATADGWRCGPFSLDRKRARHSHADTGRSSGSPPMPTRSNIGLAMITQFNLRSLRNCVTEGAHGSTTDSATCWPKRRPAIWSVRNAVPQ